MPERFSELYGFTYKPENDWFNPLLNEDTHLYVDPFQIFATKDDQWSGGHERLMRFFQMTLELLSSSDFNEDAPAFKKGAGLLMFPEPPEFCLGVSKGSVMGRGSATELQKGMIEGAVIAIQEGIENLRHFEEIALFGDEFGPDRISDMACNVLKSDFIRYTQDICRSEGIPMERFSVRNSDWDAGRQRWLSQPVELPINPYATAQAGKKVGVILTPKSFLTRFPSLDPDEFCEFALAEGGDLLRASLNYEIGQKVDRAFIVALAKSRRDLFNRYLMRLESNPKNPYDVEIDPNYLVRRTDDAKAIAHALGHIRTPKDEGSLDAFVGKLVDNFKECVELQNAWRLLWINEESERPEKDAQILFGTSSYYACVENDIDMSPETETGRGLVDFKLSQGASRKVLIELKYAKSSSFWRNEENQLTLYQQAEKCHNGYLVVVQFTDKDCSATFTERASALAKDVSEKSGHPFKVVFVDARRKISASRASSTK
jgi:hypothetical protein